jgi:hypothetical protein
MLRDTDTAALLQGLARQPDPWAWFGRDWPLENHFYRPVSTLSFWADWALAGRPSASGETDAGVAAVFGRTNALLACACVLLLFWLLRELTDSPWQTGLATSLFAVWHVPGAYLDWAATAVSWLALLCLLGMLRGGVAKLTTCVAAATVCLFAATLLHPVEDFSQRIVEWLPGRTASVMTLFALVSLAAYARFVRTTAVPTLPAATAEDLPATKSSAAPRAPRATGALLVLSGVALLAALGSYEQAVMLPALLFGVWLYFRLSGRPSAWWPHVVFWLLLAGYLALRVQVVPIAASGYQEQQFRSGPGVAISIGDYLLPGAYLFYFTVSTLSAGALLLLTPQFWGPVLAAVGNVVAYARAFADRRWCWTFFGFLLISTFAFLPMAWLHMFEHYHYLPAALRTGFVLALGAVAARCVVSAVALPELRAPARRGPAPGSLLRP